MSLLTRAVNPPEIETPAPSAEQTVLRPTTGTPPPVGGRPTVRTAPNPPSPIIDDHLTVIEARGMWNWADLVDLTRYRDLFYYLVLRDVKLRYKQTILGVGWSLFQPLATMAVFALFIGNMGGLAKDIPNYTLFVLCGVLPWTFFSNAITNAGNSLLANERLVTKAYFPRVLMPAANVGAALFDFCVASVLLTGVLVWYGVAPTWQLLMLPVIVAVLVICATGVGVLISALIVAQRDFRYLLSFGMQVWMFATPCIYLNVNSIGPRSQAFLPLNPAHGLILNLRHAILGTPFDWYSLAISTAMTVILLFAGLTYFRRVERAFADVI